MAKYGFRDLPTETLQEYGRKGGKRSVEVRREKKALKDRMEQLLEMQVTDPERWNRVAALGVEAEDIDNKMLLVVSLFGKALDGDVPAFREIRNLIGEDNTNMEQTLNQLDNVLDEIGGNI